VCGEGELGSHQVGQRLLHLAERFRLRRGEQIRRRVQGSGLDLGLRGGQRAPRALHPIGRQRHRPLEERRRRGQPSARLRTASRSLELGGDVLIRPVRGLGPVPGPTVRIGRRVGGLGQGTVRALAVRQRGRPVGGRADQRVPEHDPGAELHQPRIGRGDGRLNRKPQPPGGLPDQRGIAGRIGRRQLQQPLGLCWQGIQLPPEAFLDPDRQLHRFERPETGQLRRAQPSG
jgi:hypothetical protein